MVLHLPPLKNFTVAFLTTRVENNKGLLQGWQMWHPEEPPPPRLLEAQKKTWGGGIFHGVRGNIFQKFLALPPPNIPGLKGGGYT